jgi:hypothetical protein
MRTFGGSETKDQIYVKLFSQKRGKKYWCEAVVYHMLHDKQGNVIKYHYFRMTTRALTNPDRSL